MKHSEPGSMVEEFSRRLGKITPEQFQSALHRLAWVILSMLNRFPLACLGKMCLLPAPGEFVLRGVPHYSWQFSTEQFFVEQLHQRTHVPVPYPYFVESDTDIFGWSFVIMPRLPGIPLSDKQMVATFPSKTGWQLARHWPVLWQMSIHLPGSIVESMIPIPGAS